MNNGFNDDGKNNQNSQNDQNSSGKDERYDYYSQDKKSSGDGSYNDPHRSGYDYVPIDIQKATSRYNGFSIASMVLGIVGLVLCCCGGYFSVVLSVLAIVFSFVSRKKNGSFDGMAIAGLVCGIIAFVLGIAIIIFANSPAFEEFMKQYEEYIKNELDKMEGGNGNGGGSGIDI